MNVIEEIKRRLARHPRIRFTETANSIEIPPLEEGGFPVALIVQGDRYVVHFAGWHQRFESARDALHCVSYGLFGECRLRVDYRGSTAHRWTLEELRNGQWVPERSTRLLLFPVWRRPRTAILENRLR